MLTNSTQHHSAAKNPDPIIFSYSTHQLIFRACPDSLPNPQPRG